MGLVECRLIKYNTRENGERSEKKGHGNTVKTIREHIKTKEFKRAYLLYGTEDYLKRLYRDKLKEAVLEGADTMNLMECTGKGTDAREVREFAETMPFFADYRLVLLENTGWFKNATEFADYIPEIPESSILVFVEEEVDKRSRMFKAVKEYGYACELSGMTEQELKLWVATLMKRENRKITESTVQVLLEQVGTDMNRLGTEVEKLVCYTMGRDVVTTEDVREVCTEQLTGKIFAMTEAMALGQKKKALELYYALMELHEKPLGILFMLERQLNLVLLAKEMKERGLDRGAVASALGVPPFAAAKYMTQADRFQREELRQKLEYSIALEEEVKTGRIQEQIAVELLLV